MTEFQPIFAATDPLAAWSTIGQAIAMVVIAAMTWLQGHRSKKRDKEISKIKETVDEVHKLTNGALGDQLMIAMVAAQTLAQITRKPEHKTLAKIAVTKYEKHMATLRTVNKETLQSDIWKNKP